MFKVRFAARVRNATTGESWNGFYNPLKPFELRSRMDDIPAFECATEEQALSFISTELPTLDGAVLAEQRSRFTARAEYDDLSGETWTRSALLERP